jgi:hypothetical protein
MRYFFDTEFIEDGKTIELISIGIVSEEGREFYVERFFGDIPWERANDWVLANVRPHLRQVSIGRMAAGNTLKEIADGIVEFVGESPEFWGYYADYDWVVLCQLYGRMVDLPAGWPMFCMDIMQDAVRLNAVLPEHDVAKHGPEHNALSDARWNLDAWRQLATTGYYDWVTTAPQG